MPGSQPPVSFIPDPDQNREDTSFISVVAYGVYIPFHVRFDSVLYKSKFRENAQDPADPAEPWIHDPSGFLSIFIRFKSFHQRNPLSYKTL